MEIQVPAQFCAPIRQSANRPHLLVGCEPTALMLALVLCIVVGYSVPTVYGIGGAIFLFFLLRHLLQEMAQKDPHLIAVHHESQRYRQGFWTAKRLRVQRWRTR
jgi:type IV secretory pathway TrbD component